MTTGDKFAVMFFTPLILVAISLFAFQRSYPDSAFCKSQHDYDYWSSLKSGDTITMKVDGRKGVVSHFDVLGGRPAYVRFPGSNEMVAVWPGDLAL
jgi:hypothetical protein